MGITNGIVCLYGLFAILYAAPVLAADDLPRQTEALKLIRETAADICNSIPMEGSNQSVDLSGDAKAKLSGAIAKIANLGVEGAAKYKSEQFKGVLHHELAGAIKDNASCKLQVLKMLSERLLGASFNDKGGEIHLAKPVGCPKFSSKMRVQSEYHSSPTVTVEVLFLDAFPGCQIATVDHRVLNYSQFSELKIDIQPDRKRARVTFNLSDRPQQGFAELEFTVYQKGI